MSERVEENDAPDDLQPPTGNESFAPEQMIACPQCGRKNPPIRIKCLYCAADLPATEFSDARQLSRKLEAWEKGFNVILLPGDKISDAENAREIARMLRLETEEWGKILAAGKPLPVARAESENEAEILASNLKAKGFETVIVGDEKLAIEKFPQRLRGLEFFDDKIALKLFNSGERIEIAREDLVLIVTGGLFERRIEATQKHQRKKESKLLETAEMSSDELLIDLYARQDAAGYRIESNGFDFSCLGAEKNLLVKDNMKKLAGKLHDFASAAKFDEDYNRLRAVLGAVWTVEEKRDSKGMRRKGFGKINFETVTTISNLGQFTRYSRLLKNLL